ncbi:hypothetical protein [Tolypothrix sp. VBCCA 56010]|uniref:hypothetical protein n=1 Tax=Tolypothrix sp. VBCCA 56010 TaxID=3137731 RepID=UPI003D7DD5DC
MRKNLSSHLSLPDKDDDADAKCAGLLLRMITSVTPGALCKESDLTTTRIRELVLRLAHRLAGAVADRQSLASRFSSQFPEIAHVNSLRSIDGDVPLKWGWLCGERIHQTIRCFTRSLCGIGHHLYRQRGRGRSQQLLSCAQPQRSGANCGTWV